MLKFIAITQRKYFLLIVTLMM